MSLVLARSRTEAGRLLSCLASLTNFDLTENDIKELPKLTFSGKIGVINNSVDEDIHCNEIKEIQNAAVVGFDTESYPSAIRRYRPSLIQIASHDTALLWRLRRRGGNGGHTLWLSPTLIDILTSSSILKVGHAVCAEDALTILKNYGVDMKNIHDTLLLASQLNPGQLSLRKLVAMFLRKKLCKQQRMSDWEQRVLLDNQISYACTDAWASLTVYESIISYAKETGTSPHPPIDRAWDLLKPIDQETLVKKLIINDDPQENGGFSVSNERFHINQYRRHCSPNAMIYEKTIRDETLRVFNSRQQQRLSATNTNHIINRTVDKKADKI